MRMGCGEIRKKTVVTDAKTGLLHERPYRLAALATSPALTGEAKMP